MCRHLKRTAHRLPIDFTYCINSLFQLDWCGIGGHSGGLFDRPARLNWQIMKPETKEKLSQALKAKWASGTRKPNPPETYVKASASHKRGYAEGRRVAPGLTSEQAKERVSKRSHETMMKVNRRIGDQKMGTPNPPGPSAKGPDHFKSRYWILKAPTQQIIEGWNLSELVRQNAHLFEPADVVWHGKGKCTCRARRRLGGLFEMKKDGSGPRLLSWKGWVAIDCRSRLTGSPDVQ